jgi:kynurenine formamidase
MKLFVDHNTYINTDEPKDISISLKQEEPHLKAWYLNDPVMSPVMENGFIGSVSEGGAVNFRNIHFNPHGHVTHTECLGHITNKVYSINLSLKSYFFKAQLISIEPRLINVERYKSMDLVIQLSDLKKFIIHNDTEAIIIRTLPNALSKEHLNYSDTNPPYLDIETISFFNDHGIKHLLIDLPSVDRESDDGELLFHHAFWGVPDNLNFERTITELIYVDSCINDGNYILELQVAPFENDAAPSRPTLYELKKA